MYTVYLLDDEALMLESLTNAIEWKENNLLLAGKSTDPKKALGELEELSPDIVFCDLKMPGMDGIDFIRRCKEKGIKSEFIMLSAFAEFEASREFFLLGGHDYLLKPIDNDALHLTLERVTQRFTERDGEKMQQTHSRGSSVFDELTSYIEENYHQKHSLRSLSEKFHLSETYICDLFAKNFSTTFTLFVAGIRMRKAAELITKSDIPMKQICHLCGYPDYLYFCRVFKNHYGITPTAYRENRHEN